MAAAGLVLALGVAWHEWVYHQHHPGRTGVSGVLVVLALATACGCGSALLGARAEEKAAKDRLNLWNAMIRRLPSGDETGDDDGE